MFLLSILFLTSVLFVFLQPALASKIVPFYSFDSVTRLVNNAVRDDHINAQEFWKTREFYDTGSMEYNHDGLPQQKVKSLLQQLHIDIRTNEDTLPFLIYQSPTWQSIEFLVDRQTLDDVIITTARPETTRLTTNKELIFHTNSTGKFDGNLYIIFIKPVREMKTANGFFDYASHDVDLLKGKYWLSISVVKL